jgi:predicted dehydrogenase
VPADHWVHDPEQGGGRIRGEVCHFVDLVQHLTGSVPESVRAESLRAPGYKDSDNVALHLRMADGSVGSITYVSGGDKRHPRERIEVFGGGAVGVIDNFRRATFTLRGRRETRRAWLGVERGHRQEIEALLDAIRRGGPEPVPFDEHVYATLATFAAERSLATRSEVQIPRVEATQA